MATANEHHAESDTQLPVPIIDFSAFTGGDTNRQAETAAEISRACREIGFFYLKNHGVDSALLEEMFGASAEFFDQPQDIKQDVAWQSAEENLGYVAIGRESLDPSQPGDFKEAFNINEDDAMNGERDCRHPDNRWPQRPASFRPVMERFFNACVDTADAVLHAFAIALDTPRDFFVDKHAAHDHTMRVLHYPALGKAGQDEAATPRAGGHTDYGSITLLFQDDVGGLEVRSLDGEWRFAPPIPGTVLINTGDLMQRWTNDVFRSTPHRVGASLSENAGRDRYSVAFFCHPDMSADISCLDSCHDQQRPAQYPPITAHEHLMERLGATYG